MFCIKLKEVSWVGWDHNHSKIFFGLNRCMFRCDFDCLQPPLMLPSMPKPEQMISPMIPGLSLATSAPISLMSSSVPLSPATPKTASLPCTPRTISPPPQNGMGLGGPIRRRVSDKCTLPISAGRFCKTIISINMDAIWLFHNLGLLCRYLFFPTVKMLEK